MNPIRHGPLFRMFAVVSAIMALLGGLVLHVAGDGLAPPMRTFVVVVSWVWWLLAFACAWAGGRDA